MSPQLAYGVSETELQTEAVLENLEGSLRH